MDGGRARATGHWRARRHVDPFASRARGEGELAESRVARKPSKYATTISSGLGFFYEIEIKPVTAASFSLS